MNKPCERIDIGNLQGIRFNVKKLCHCLNKVILWNTIFALILSHTDIGRFFIKANLSTYIFLCHSAFTTEEMDSFSYCHSEGSFRLMGLY